MPCPSPDSGPRTPDSPAPPCPLWQRLTGIDPRRGDAQPTPERLKGLARLAEHVTKELKAIYAAALQAKDKRLKDSSWEPAHTVAAALGIAEGALNRFLREHDGRSARELWDFIRASDAARGLSQEVRRLLQGVVLTPMVPLKSGLRGPQTAPLPGDCFDAAQRALRQRRRELGLTRAAAIRAFGFKNAGRCSLALERTYSLSAPMLEAELLWQAAEYYFARYFGTPEGKKILNAPPPPATEGRNLWRWMKELPGRALGPLRKLYPRAAGSGQLEEMVDQLEEEEYRAQRRAAQAGKGVALPACPAVQAADAEDAPPEDPPLVPGPDGWFLDAAGNRVMYAPTFAREDLAKKGGG